MGGVNVEVPKVFGLTAVMTQLLQLGLRVLLSERLHQPHQRASGARLCGDLGSGDGRQRRAIRERGDRLQLTRRCGVASVWW